MNILVVGGAGYIGSHMVKLLLRSGHHVVVYDDLSTGHKDAISGAPLVIGRLQQPDRLSAVFNNYKFDAVMHFASSIEVAESVRHPAKYYDNNVVGTLCLLEAMMSANIKSFIFSSTAATFGTPAYTPIDENHSQHPINAYGRSKLIIETILKDYSAAYDLRSVSLRYFNAAGADTDGVLGERHQPETHLIPLLLQTAAGKRKSFSVFGTDYPTPDGTCIRDFIHVEDICRAHLLSIQYLAAGGASTDFNLGNGKGFSVKQVISAVERITETKINISFESPRAGDPPVLIADSAKATNILGWYPQRPRLDDIVADAWRWERRQVDINSLAMN